MCDCQTQPLPPPYPSTGGDDHTGVRHRYHYNRMVWIFCFRFISLVQIIIIVCIHKILYRTAVIPPEQVLHYSRGGARYRRTYQ